MLQNREIKRGDDVDLVFTISGDYSQKSMVFVAKRLKTLTSARVLEKSNDILGLDNDEMEVSYNATTLKSTITVHLLEANTQSSEDEFLYFDIYNDTDNETLIYGKLWILSDVQTPFDSGIVVESDPLVGSVRKGTTAERIAFGLTLGSTDICIWIDTDENTFYGWNGSEWI
jgi:hypothetical protein